MKHVLKDETGKRYNRLVVLSRDVNCKYGQARWLCKCDCGNEIVAVGSLMRRGHTKSCGCFRREKLFEQGQTFIHGQCRNYDSTIAYRLWNAARVRARKRKLEFTLLLDDIVVPEFCPVTGIRLESHKGTVRWSSPTLDRVDNAKGYTKENSWVISARANSWKSNFTLDELRQMLYALEQRTNQWSTLRKKK